MNKTLISKITIGDTKWKAYLFEDKAYVEAHGEDSVAVTVFPTKEIHFRHSARDALTVRHELFHAYFDQALVSSCDLSMVDTVEVACEVIGKYGDEYFKNVLKIHKLLMRKK